MYFRSNRRRWLLVALLHLWWLLLCGRYLRGLWRSPALAALSVLLLLAAAVSLWPPGEAAVLPLQPWRLIATAIPLATLPAAMFCVRLLRELLKSESLAGACVALGLIALAWLHPPVELSAAALSAQEAEDLQHVRAALKRLPPGMAVVEIFELEEGAGLTRRPSTSRGRMTSRALVNQLAMDGRPVIWTIFREHAVSAPLATAVRNLFSTSPEKFGLGGLGLQRGSAGGMSVATSLQLDRHLGGAYFLVKSSEQVGRLESSSDVRMLSEVGGWHLFVTNVDPAPRVEAVMATPVVAWLPAKFRNRAPDEVDLFNLGEYLAFEGRPDICVLWASSEATDVWAIISMLPGVIVVIDPAAVHSNVDARLNHLKEAGANCGSSC